MLSVQTVRRALLLALAGGGTTIYLVAEAQPRWQPMLRDLRRNHIGVWASALASRRAPFATLRAVMAALNLEKMSTTLVDFCVGDDAPLRSYDGVPIHMLPLVSTLQAMAKTDATVLVIEGVEDMDADSAEVFALFEHVLYAHQIAVILCVRQSWFDATACLTHTPVSNLFFLD